jgi:hypothetical protein
MDHAKIIDSFHRGHCIDAYRFFGAHFSYEGGEGVLSEHPNKFNLLVTISTTANYAEGSGYSVNATRIAVGEKLALRFPDYVAEGYCIYLETE